MKSSFRIILATLVLAGALAASASASDQILFTATDNAITPIVNAINNENVRIDISAWYLTEHLISESIVNAYVNRHVPVRVIGDRGAIFEIDANTRAEFIYLAQNGVPIRLRYYPTDYPYIDHWKAGMFVGQGLLEFGSANWTTFELAPVSSTNYNDDTALVTTDSTLFNAFQTVFDQYWADTSNFVNWASAYQSETGRSWASAYPSAAPMNISTARLVPNNPMPGSMVWGQGDEFNIPLTNAINAEGSEIDFVIYRLSVDNITNALVNRFNAGVRTRLIVEPNEYRNGKFPEFELTGAKEDLLWVAGIPMKQRGHQGLTHMKTLITSAVATNASSNFTAHWQRDHDYFVGAGDKPAIYSAMKNRFNTMWSDSSGFVPFRPQPPDWASITAPGNGAGGAARSPTFIWNRAKWAIYYDVYVGTSPASMQRVAIVNADLSENPPSSYSWTPSYSLQARTQYFWQVVTRTFASAKDASLVNTSPVWSFTTGDTGGNPGPQPPPPSPSPTPTPPPPPPTPSPSPSPPPPTPPPSPAPTGPVPSPSPGAPTPKGGFVKAAQDASGSNSEVILQWTAVPDAEYAVCVQRSDSGQCEGGWWRVGRTSLVVFGLSAGNYYWQVAAITPNGVFAADGGAWGSFTMAGGTPGRPGHGYDAGKATPRPGATEASPGTSRVRRR